jgi:hypothetical protein
MRCRRAAPAKTHNRGGNRCRIGARIGEGVRPAGGQRLTRRRSPSRSGGRPVVGGTESGARGRAAGGGCREIRSRCRSDTRRCLPYRRRGRPWCRSRWSEDRTVGPGGSPVGTPKTACHRPSSMFLPKLNSQHAVTLCKLGSMFRSSVSNPAFSPAIWPESVGSNAGRTARDWLSRFSDPTDGGPSKALGHCTSIFFMAGRGRHHRAARQRGSPSQTATSGRN